MNQEKFKGLKITIEKVKETINECISPLNGSVKETQLKAEAKVTTLQYKIEIPGNDAGIIDVFLTKKGITLFPTGKNVTLSTDICKRITQFADKVISGSRTFKSITIEMFNKFKNFLSESNFNFKTREEDTKIKLEIKTKNNLELTVTWYKTSHKFLIQGMKTLLWDDVILWLASEIKENPIEIIEIVFDEYEKFKLYKLKYSDDMLDNLLKEKVGKVYNYNNVLKDFDKKWLKTAYLLCKIDIKMPEYYPVVSSSLKVIEGLLKRICLNKFGSSSFGDGNSFYQFDERPQNGGVYELKEEYKNSINNSSVVKLIENLYKFVKEVRHTYSHSNGINPILLEDKSKATDILKTVISLIKEAGRFHSKIL